MGQVALEHVHKAHSKDDKLLHLKLAKTALELASGLIGDLLPDSALIADPRWRDIMAQAGAWEGKIARLKGSATDKIISVDFEGPI